MADTIKLDSLITIKIELISRVYADVPTKPVEKI